MSNCSLEMVNDVEEALVLNPCYFICDIAGDRDKSLEGKVQIFELPN
jgi:hypothetical protein